MKNFILILFIAFFSWHSNAQEKEISGTVTTADDGLPLPGASVIIKGTSSGAQTDFDGLYTIKANIGDILVVSYIGMKSAEVTIGVDNVYNIALESDNETLDEVVVVAYASSTKRAMTSSVIIRGHSNYSPSKAELRRQEKQRFHNKISNQLAGQVSGFHINGKKAINSDSNVLYIVDGIPIQKGYNMLIKNIKPEDIEHMNVYKSSEAFDKFGHSK